MTSEEFQRLTKKLGHHLKYGTEPLTDEESEELQKKIKEDVQLPSIGHKTPVNGDYYGYLHLDVDSRGNFK